MAVVRSCDRCNSLDNVERYSMQHKPRQHTADIAGYESTNTLSMGGVDLCQMCWEQVAQPRSLEYIRDIDRCDFCNAKEGRTIIRLTIKQSKREGAKVVDRGKGSLALCGECWADYGLPKMRSKPDKQTLAGRLFRLNARRVGSA